MKARIKKTSEIVDVYHETQPVQKQVNSKFTVVDTVLLLLLDLLLTFILIYAIIA